MADSGTTSSPGSLERGAGGASAEAAAAIEAEQLMPLGVNADEYRRLRELGLLSSSDIPPATLTSAQLAEINGGVPLPPTAQCGPGGQAVWVALLEGMLGSDKQLAELAAAAPLSTLLAEAARTMRGRPPRPIGEEEIAKCVATVPDGVFQSVTVRYGGFRPPAVERVAGAAAAEAVQRVRLNVISEFARVTDEDVRRNPHTLYVVSCPTRLEYIIEHEGTTRESVSAVFARPPPERVLSDAAEGTDAHLLRALPVPLSALATVERAVPSLRVLPVPEAEQRRAAEQGRGLVRYPNVMPVYAASAGALQAGRDSTPGAAQHADWPSAERVRSIAMNEEVSNLPRELELQVDAIRDALSTGAYTSVVVREVYGPLTVSDDGGVVDVQQPRNQFGALSSITPQIVGIADEVPLPSPSSSPAYAQVGEAMNVIEGKPLSRPEHAAAAGAEEEVGADEAPAAAPASSDDDLDDGDGGNVVAWPMDESLASTPAAFDAAASAPRRDAKDGRAEATLSHDAAEADTKDAGDSPPPLPAQPADALSTGLAAAAAAAAAASAPHGPGGGRAGSRPSHDSTEVNTKASDDVERELLAEEFM